MLSPLLTMSLVFLAGVACQELNDAVAENVALQKRVDQLEEENQEFKGKIDTLIRAVDILQHSIIDNEEKDQINIDRVRRKRDNHEHEVILMDAEDGSGQELEFEEMYKRMRLLNVKRSCQEYWDAGIRKSGWHLVDPDGPLNPANYIRVWCTMTETHGVTEVLHDSEMTMNVTQCPLPGCYSRNVSYSASDEQIRALIEISGSCSQDIRYDCTLAPLRHPVHDTDFGYWFGPDGRKNVHWDDTVSPQGNSTHRCACDSTRSKCAKSRFMKNKNMEYKCNCDAYSAMGQFDQGTISEKSSLPVKQLRFGGVEKDPQAAQHTLGRLKCHGKKVLKPGSSCEAIRLSGNYESRFYVVKEENKAAKVVYCNMSQSPDANLEVFVENVETTHEDTRNTTQIQEKNIRYLATKTFQTKLTLVGGKKASEGNVYFNGAPVCDDIWTSVHGRVVCAELGYSGLVGITTASHFGSVAGWVYNSFGMDDVQCTGNELRLEDCSYTTTHNCKGGEGAGVICTSEKMY